MHGLYFMYTNIQCNNCHFPTELVQMFQLINVWNFATIHHLLQCAPIYFNRTERRHIVHATLLITCAQMYRSSLNRKTGRQTARIVIRLIRQFGGHCSKWCVVAKCPTLTSWNVCVCSAKPGHTESSDRSAAKKTDEWPSGQKVPTWSFVWINSVGKWQMFHCMLV